jgi:hypothetical protein
MALKIPSVRALKRKDLNSFKHHNETVRGFIIELDDEVLAVYGVIHTIPMQAFSEMSEKLKKYPRVIMKAILSFENILNQYSNEIIAIPSTKHPNASKVLERIGFRFENGVYRWKQ